MNFKNSISVSSSCLEFSWYNDVDVVCGMVLPNTVKVKIVRHTVTFGFLGGVFIAEDKRNANFCSNSKPKSYFESWLKIFQNSSFSRTEADRL